MASYLLLWLSCAILFQLNSVKDYKDLNSKMLLSRLPQLVKTSDAVLTHSLSGLHLCLSPILDKRQNCNTMIKGFTSDHLKKKNYNQEKLEVIVCPCTVNLLLYSPWGQNYIVIITLCHIHHPPPRKLSNHYKIAAVTSSLVPKLKP